MYDELHIIFTAGKTCERSNFFTYWTNICLRGPWKFGFYLKNGVTRRSKCLPPLFFTNLDSRTNPNKSQYFNSVIGCPRSLCECDRKFAAAIAKLDDECQIDSSSGKCQSSDFEVKIIIKKIIKIINKSKKGDDNGR